MADIYSWQYDHAINDMVKSGQTADTGFSKCNVNVLWALLKSLFGQTTFVCLIWWFVISFCAHYCHLLTRSGSHTNHILLHCKFYFIAAQCAMLLWVKWFTRRDAVHIAGILGTRLAGRLQLWGLEPDLCEIFVVDTNTNIGEEKSSDFRYIFFFFFFFNQIFFFCLKLWPVV